MHIVSVKPSSIVIDDFYYDQSLMIAVAIWPDTVE